MERVLKALGLGQSEEVYMFLDMGTDMYAPTLGMNVKIFNSNLGTSSTGTTDKTTITSLNENGKILVQTQNGIAVVHKNSEGYINAYGRVNGHGAYYSRVPIDSTTRALTQIGNTTISS